MTAIISSRIGKYSRDIFPILNLKKLMVGFLASSPRVPDGNPSSAAPGSVARRSWVCTQHGHRDYASTPEKSLMASDPELPRFAGPNCHWQKAGQSHVDLPGKAADNSAPWQHLQPKVLHFVCELGASIIARITVDPKSPNQVTSEQLTKSVKVLMNIPQPYYNHYGGMITFGPDGKL
jgi:hypothetical protein